MADTTHVDPHQNAPYLKIFFILLTLTIIELGIAYITFLRPLVITVLVVLGLLKAALVALFYMHLKMEGTLIYAAAITPLVCATILILATTLDIHAADFSRNLVEYSQTPSDHGLGGHGGGHGAVPAPTIGGGGGWGAPEPAPAAPIAAAATSHESGAAPAPAPAAPAGGGSASVRYLQGAPPVPYIVNDPNYYE